MLLRQTPPSRATSPAPTAAASTTVAPSTTSATTTSAATTTAPSPTQLPPACPPVEAIGSVSPTTGCASTFAGLIVTDVPADEGFWVTFVDGQPIWVHLTSATESPQHVRAGDRVTVQATITSPDDGTHPGIPADQADRLAARPFYLAVPHSGLEITGS